MKVAVLLVFFFISVCIFAFLMGIFFGPIGTVIAFVVGLTFTFIRIAAVIGQ